MGSRLIHGLATTDALAEAFSDDALLQAMLDFESALARAGARAGAVPSDAAAAITRAAEASGFDARQIAHDGRAAATVCVPFVRALEARVATTDVDAARWVHFGATSQDVFDTAIVLCIRRARVIVDADRVRIVAGLRRLSGDYAQAIMLGRTLLQPAPPVTFGLKAAGWLAATERAWAACAAAFDDVQVLQFGGAAGTLAALGDYAPDVERALAGELNLQIPDAPWHAHRDRVVSLVASLALYTGVLGKIARDIVLLMQPEVGEVSEPGGGSSTMPHKKNPAGCAAVLAAAYRMPGLTAAMLGSMTHEHERSVGGWHSEAPTVTDAVQTAGAAIAAMADIVETLRVEPVRMQRNVEAARGVILSERLSRMIVPKVGQERAAELLKVALDRVHRFDVTLAKAVADTPALASLVSESDRKLLEQPETYLGMADAFRERLLRAPSRGQSTQN